MCWTGRHLKYLARWVSKTGVEKHCCKWMWLWWPVLQMKQWHFIQPNSHPHTPFPYLVLAHQRSAYVQPYLLSQAAQACRHYKHQKQPAYIFFGWVWGLGSKYSLSNGWCQWSKEREHIETLHRKKDSICILNKCSSLATGHNLLHLQDIKPAKPISGRAGKTGEKVHL